MIVLDENIIDSQRHLLRVRGIAFRQIGVEVGQSGMSDQQVLALLHEEVAEYVAATLRHPDLKTWTQRQGVVLRVSSQGGRA